MYPTDRRGKRDCIERPSPIRLTTIIMYSVFSHDTGDLDLHFLELSVGFMFMCQQVCCLSLRLFTSIAGLIFVVTYFFMLFFFLPVSVKTSTVVAPLQLLSGFLHVLQMCERDTVHAQNKGCEDYWPTYRERLILISLVKGNFCSFLKTVQVAVVFVQGHHSFVIPSHSGYHLIGRLVNPWLCPGICIFIEFGITALSHSLQEDKLKAITEALLT